MPAAVIPFRTATPSRPATWSLLEIALPERSPEPLGILLLDDATGDLTVRLRDERDFEDLEEQDEDFLAALAADLEAKGREPGGGAALLASLEDTLSGVLRISDRTAFRYAGDANQAAERLFGQYVDNSVKPFVTHLPLYGLRAAATRFGEEFDAAEVSEADAWVRAPRGLRLSDGMFVAQVVGRSMEPLIPDGSYCIFRGPVTGSRQGKRLLIEQTGGFGKDGQSGVADVASRYTVKRYTSRKTVDPDGSWHHESIRLEPLNPEFEAFELDAGEFRVIAEFVQVLQP